jgi:molybdopterin/thiamine biosynthesis adenylyltransferase
MSFEGLRVLLVGVGGLGCPAALALAAAGVGSLALADDDEVDPSNLHRQILYSEADVGASKVRCATAVLTKRYPRLRVIEHETRFLPHVAEHLLRDVDVVVEGADNFATKFLVADACALYQKPVIHGAALQWQGTVLSVAREGRPCYRCVFEDLPAGPAPSCAEAGVMGPVCGVIGALMAEAALKLVRSDRGGTFHSFDGKALRLRSHQVGPRPGCPLCGSAARRPSLDVSDYTGALS